jgi:NAD(P)-dependent dehydrogenase (short-subunit alcohol dehydrogenase family)/acyl carrier protein
LITGGLGGVGHVLARHLVTVFKAKLVLTGKTAMPDKEQWPQWLATHPADEPISRKIHKVQELEALGAELLIITADVADEAQMNLVIARAENRFGKIDGVIHTAGTVGRDSMSIIAEIDKQKCHANFQPKVQGLLVLEKVLRAKQIDFCLLMSSISSVLGGLGLAAYSAANLFMDAFTRLIRRESPTAWISVAWDGWRTPDTPAAKKQDGFSAAAWEDFAMSPQEGTEACRRVLALENPGPVVHSTGDLQARLNQWLNLESLRQKQFPIRKEDGAASHTRPSLPNPYAAPTNPLEEIIAEVWQKFLGIDQVGIDDNFFDLNATSLDIVRVNSLLRDELKKDIPVVTMFNYPTIDTLARFLSQEESCGAENKSELDRDEIILQSHDRIKQMRRISVR